MRRTSELTSLLPESDSSIHLPHGWHLNRKTGYVRLLFSKLQVTPIAFKMKLESNSLHSKPFPVWIPLNFPAKLLNLFLHLPVATTTTTIHKYFSLGKLIPLASCCSERWEARTEGGSWQRGRQSLEWASQRLEGIPLWKGHWTASGILTVGSGKGRAGRLCKRRAGFLRQCALPSRSPRTSQDLGKVPVPYPPLPTLT